MTPRGPTAAEMFERFKNFTRRLVAVPKTEIDKEARAYRQRRQRARGTMGAQGRKRGKGG